MKCKDCDCARKGWFKSKPEEYICIGVKEPFVIDDINSECTEYGDKKNNYTIESDENKAIRYQLTVEEIRTTIYCLESSLMELGRGYLRSRLENIICKLNEQLKLLDENK